MLKFGGDESLGSSLGLSCLVAVEQLYFLKNSVLLNISFLCPLARDSRFQLRCLCLFVWSVPIDVSGLLFSPTPCLGHMSQKETQRTHHHVILCILRSPTSLLSSLHFLQSSSICLIYEFHGFCQMQQHLSYLVRFAQFRTFVSTKEIAELIHGSSKMKLLEQSCDFTTVLFFFT